MGRILNVASRLCREPALADESAAPPVTCTEVGMSVDSWRMDTRRSRSPSLVACLAGRLSSPFLKMTFRSELVADYEMFDVCDMNGVTVIRLRMRELDETKLQRFTKELNTVVEAPNREQIVVDLGEVSFLTSTGIGAIIALQKKLHSSGSTMKLCSLHPDIRSLFAITQVDRLFDIQPDADEAVKSFSC